MTSRTDATRHCPLGPVWDLERDPGLGERPLGADDALRDGRLRHQEGPGNLIGREPSHQPQCERDAGVGRKHRMARDEDQSEQIVIDVIGVRRLDRWHVSQRPTDFCQLASVGLLTAHEIDRTALGNGHEPGTRIARGT